MPRIIRRLSSLEEEAEDHFPMGSQTFFTLEQSNFMKDLLFAFHRDILVKLFVVEQTVSPKGEVELGEQVVGKRTETTIGLDE